MNRNKNDTRTRRKVLKLIGQGAVVLPLAGLVACSGGSDSTATPAKPAASSPPPRPEPVQPEPATAPAPAAAQNASMPRLAEDDPQARSLNYVHEASSVDPASQSRYQSGQVCSNCALYTGGEGSEWGPCTIFPGKQVKASGWCSVYAPKS